MAEYILGYEHNEILRHVVGSPATWFEFSERSHCVAIDNIGTSGVTYKFDGVADTGSTSGYLPAGLLRAFDVRVGSVSIMASSGGSSEVQVTRLS